MTTLPKRLASVIVFAGAIAGSFGLYAASPSQSAAARRPAPSLVPPATPAKPASADGFLQRWLILEPIRATPLLTEEAVRTLVKGQQLPNPLETVPRHGEKVKVGDADLAWHAVDTLGYNVNLYHFAYALEKPTSNVLFWAVTVVHAPRDMQDVRLAIGSNAASVWWVNGQEAIALYNDRQAVIDDGVSKRLTLRKGPNVIRAAIVNGGGATDFCARFLDEESRPIKGLTVSLAPR